jgi:hypothetical protein
VRSWPPWRGSASTTTPASSTLFHDWATQVRGCVACLRALAGTDPDAPDLSRLVGELLLKSREFVRLWERYDIKGRAHGRKTFHHPEVGHFTLGYQTLELEGIPGHPLVTYYAEPDTAEYDALVLLDPLGSQPTPRDAASNQNEATSSSP